MPCDFCVMYIYCGISCDLHAVLQGTKTPVPISTMGKSSREMDVSHNEVTVRDRSTKKKFKTVLDFMER